VKRFASWVQATAVAMGGPGLFIIGFLDSSFLSFPELNDLLLVGMVMKHPHLLIYYALMATLGSVAGAWRSFSSRAKAARRSSRNVSGRTTSRPACA